MKLYTEISLNSWAWELALYLNRQRDDFTSIDTYERVNIDLDELREAILNFIINE